MTLLEATAPAAPPLTALPVVVIGGGPIGLAAAAHLVERGIGFELLETGDSIASSMRAWGHVRLFSPWRHLIDPAARRLLEAHGWAEPRSLDAAPSGSELVEHYLEPLAALPSIAEKVRTGVRVTDVSRLGMDRTRSSGRASTPFVVRLRGTNGETTEALARAVIDASGTYRTPNRLGSSGLDPLGSDDVADHISHALPDVLGSERSRFSGRHVTVVGAGHSAATTLIALGTLIQTSPQTRVTWVVRNAAATRVFTSDDDGLPRRASLGAKLTKLVDFGVIELRDRFEITRLARAGERVTVMGSRGAFETDVIVNATGYRPDLDMLREVRLDLDDIVEAPRTLAPLIDPNVHSCGTVEPHGLTELRHPDPGFFIVGMKSYGRAPTFLLATGYEQVRSVVAELAGDLTAARSVQLVLPATGVCSTTTDCCD